jgi:hypothetical protein
MIAAIAVAGAAVAWLVVWMLIGRLVGSARRR